MKRNYTHIILFFLAVSLQAQPLTRLNVEFQSYKTPLAGGLNSPQFSEIDLNNDGKQDLYIFDRYGNVSLTYLNNGANNQINYTHTPQYQAFFPALNDWVLLRDFNGDGIADIFTYNDEPIAGIRVFKGVRQGSNLSFQRINFNTIGNVINYPLANGSKTNLYVNNVDIPSIDDIDGDGDLDILSFEIGGGHAYMYKNLSIERGYKRDSLIFELFDRCWGQFFDNGTQNGVKLGTADVCAESFRKVLTERAHPGASLTTYDKDGDGDKDLIIGSISYPNLSGLTNGGTKTKAWINAQEANFPATTEGVNIPIFPAAYVLDVNNDGKKDMIASPNSTNFVENLNVAWLYLNNSTTVNSNFQINQKSFLVSDMVDFGTGANPAFVDYNADGLVDLVVGNNTFFKTEGREARLFLFKNIGSVTVPKFQLQDNNWLDFKSLSTIDNYNFSPTFGDMDNDGDIDLIVGEDSGTLYYVENKGGAGKPLNMSNPIPVWKGIEAGVSCKPQIVDLNKDGLPDLVIGNRTGFLRYFPNIGTRTNPNFNTTAANNFLGKVDTRLLGFVSGYSAPQFFVQNGQFLLLTGTEDGKIQLYDQIDGNLNGTFRLVNSDYGQIRDGWRSTPCLIDINGDKKLELWVGNQRGGISAYSTAYATRTKDIVEFANLVTVYPTLNSNNILNISQNVPNDYLNLNIINTLGQVIFNQKNIPPQLEVDISTFTKGIYFIEIISTDFKRQVVKIVKI